MKESIKFAVTIEGKTGDMSDLLNVDFENGLIKKRKGWKTFEEMVSVLKDLNKKYKKLGYVGDFTIRLPLREKRGT